MIEETDGSWWVTTDWHKAFIEYVGESTVRPLKLAVAIQKAIQPYWNYPEFHMYYCAPDRKAMPQWLKSKFGYPL